MPPKSRFLPSEQGPDGLPVDESAAVAQLELEQQLISFSARHLTKSEMAKRLNISVAKVSSYLDAMKQRMSLLNTDDFRNYQLQELAKLQEVEREAWSAWEASRGSTERVEEETKNSAKDSDEAAVERFLFGGGENDGQPSSSPMKLVSKKTITTESHGDPRY